MTVHKQINIYHKHVSVAKKDTDFRLIFYEIVPNIVKLTDLICLVLNSLSFYKIFFLHLAYQIFAR